jgi:NDP-sugar pyrophosphorylase family protein
VILAGGIGARLQSVVSDRPKPLASVRGRPFMQYLFDQLVAAGVRNVVLCTGHMAGLIEEVLGDEYGPLRLQYSAETEPMGTAGALKLALPLLGTDPVLVMNGDSYCNVDLEAFAVFHRHARAEASIALAFVRDCRRFGTVHVDYMGRVERFEEKDGSGGAWINAGIYLLSIRLIDAICTGKQMSLEREVFPLWSGRGLYAYQSTAKLIDIGTPESYEEAQVVLAGGAGS